MYSKPKYDINPPLIHEYYMAELKKLSKENDNKEIFLLMKKGKTTTDEFKNIKEPLNYSNIYNTNYTINNSFSISNSNYSYYSEEEMNSTIDNTKSLINSQNSLIINNSEAKFNPIRASFCEKFKLYDICLNELNNNDINCPVKYKINDQSFAFLYPNEPIITYSITISGFLKNDNIKILPVIPKNIKNQFNYFLGLLFCGKIINIKTDKGIVNKKCAPHEFMCKNCNDINKNIYNIKSHYLINISGRVAKINKGKYHCFGHFLCKNQIEDCIKNFCCKSCEMLNLYAKYYQEK